MDDMEKHELEILNEAAYVVRRAEMEEMTGTDAKPWEAQEDEPLTMADFRRLPPGSDERELILAHLILDVWNEVDHLRQHVCPNAEGERDEA